jgi:hypothetical protein
MEEQELKNLWQTYDQQLRQAKILNLQSWVVQLQTKEAIQLMRAKSKLNALANFKKWVVLLGVLWVALLLLLAYYSFSFEKIFFFVSACVLALFNIYAVAAYIRQILLIREIDNSESIVEAQEKTARLQSSTIRIVRVLFLQMPFYTTWFITPSSIVNRDPGFWFISLPVALLFVFFSVWLYRNINARNAHKKWFRLLFSGPEWTPVIQAIEFMREIDEFKKENGFKEI